MTKEQSLKKVSIALEKIIEIKEQFGNTGNVQNVIDELYKLETHLEDC